MQLTFLFILLMAVCKGCKKAFNNDHGLKWHQISCKPAKETTSSLFQMWQELQRNLNSKRRISLNEPQGVPEIVSINISREYPILIYWKFHSQSMETQTWLSMMKLMNLSLWVTRFPSSTVMMSNDYRIVNSQSQRIVRSEVWWALKNASYPTSIVFKGLRKSRVEEESSIED